MKKLAILCMGLSVVFLFSACKSKESAYKKIYEKAKQQELAEAAAAQEEQAAVETAPVAVTVPASTLAPVASVWVEKVELVSGDGLKAYSVICGSFGVKANADGLKTWLDGEGYSAKVVYNAANNMYRVAVESFDTRDEAARARDAFKAKYPGREDFQGSWLLYRVH